MLNNYDFTNDDEMNYIQACLEFAAQLGQIADDTLEAVCLLYTSDAADD